MHSRSKMRPGRRGMLLVVAPAATVLLALTGCDKGAPKAGASSPPASLSPSSTIDAAQADANRKVLAAYNGYINAQVAAAAIPDPDSKDLRKYAGDPLLAQMRYDLNLLKTNGLVRQGAPKVAPKVTELQLGATPPVATVEDCYDVSDQHVVNKATGKSADAPGQSKRYIVTSQAKFFGGQDGWLIVQSDADRSRQC
jgi:hypothetical protein